MVVLNSSLLILEDHNEKFKIYSKYGRMTLRVSRRGMPQFDVFLKFSSDCYIEKWILERV